MPIKTAQYDVSNENSGTRDSVAFSIKPQISSLTSSGNIERVLANLGDIGTNPIDVQLNIRSKAVLPPPLTLLGTSPWLFFAVRHS